MDPRIRIGAAAIGALLIVGAKLFSMYGMRMPTKAGTSGPQPSWVSQYIFTAFGAMLIVGAITVDGAYAVLAFVVVLFGLATYKIVANIRAGGYGGEE